MCKVQCLVEWLKNSGFAVAPLQHNQRSRFVQRRSKECQVDPTIGVHRQFLYVRAAAGEPAAQLQDSAMLGLVNEQAAWPQAKQCQVQRLGCAGGEDHLVLFSLKETGDVCASTVEGGGGFPAKVVMPIGGV